MAGDAGYDPGEKRDASGHWAEAVNAAVAKHPFGQPSAVKRGRNPKWPHVPIIDYGEQKIGVQRTHTEQIMGKAFATREEAVAHAAKVIEARREDLRQKLHRPEMRALREHHGLPREIIPDDDLSGPYERALWMRVPGFEGSERTSLGPLVRTPSNGRGVNKGCANRVVRRRSKAFEGRSKGRSLDGLAGCFDRSRTGRELAVAP